MIPDRLGAAGVAWHGMAWHGAAMVWLAGVTTKAQTEVKNKNKKQEVKRMHVMARHGTFQAGKTGNKAREHPTLPGVRNIAGVE